MFVAKNLDYKLLNCKFPKKRHLLHAFCPNPVRFCSPSLVVLHTTYIHGTSLRRMNPVIVPLLYFRRSFFHTLFSIQISLHVSVVQANYPSYIFRAWLDGSGFCREQWHFSGGFTYFLCKSDFFEWFNKTLLKPNYFKKQRSSSSFLLT